MARMSINIPMDVFHKRITLIPRSDGMWEFRYRAPLQMDGWKFFDLIYEDLSQVKQSGFNRKSLAYGDFEDGSYTRRLFDSKQAAMHFAASLGYSGYIVIDTLEAVDEFKNVMNFRDRLL